MRIFLMFSLLCSTLLFSDFTSPSYTNKLIHEDSPYLQQHAHNPVNWYPWGEEALKKARSQGKPIFLSIGYSTCHWCHVMARESFENEAIAQLLNRDFICIKVDREELPHLDKQYQNLHRLVKKRSGGWPLTAILTEEAKPYFIGTYIPDVYKYNHEGLNTLLPKYAREYKDSRIEVFKQADAIDKMMKDINTRPLPEIRIELSIKEEIYEALLEEYDELYHGFSIQPKFPESTKISLLFDLDALGVKGARKMALEVLRSMALRGLYDQVEGGFFRYSTDAAWEIPHFEKMLYTNAELIPLYVKAYKITQDKLYKQIVEESIEMIEERFENEGVYYSASSAESDHEEGAYFIYSYKQIQDALDVLPDKQREELEEALEFSEIGNFKEKTHINFYADSRPGGFERLREKLKVLRKDREYPFIDMKINTAWNAMMIEALFSASLINEKYSQLAQKRLQALLKKMYVKGELYHQALPNKEPMQKGLLEDYAFVISTLIRGYGVNYDEQYLHLAKVLSDKAIKKFYDGSFWYLSDDGIMVYADMQDKYYMAPMNKILLNLLKLASLKADREYLTIVSRTLKSKSALLKKDPQDHVGMIKVLLGEKKGYISLKAEKKKLKKQRKKIAEIGYPFLVIKAEGKGDNYLACDIKQCFGIEKRLEEIIRIIENR